MSNFFFFIDFTFFIQTNIYASYKFDHITIYPSIHWTKNMYIAQCVTWQSLISKTNVCLFQFKISFRILLFFFSITNVLFLFEGISMHKGYAFVQFTNPFDARNACHGEDGRTILSQVLGKFWFNICFFIPNIWASVVKMITYYN